MGDCRWTEREANHECGDEGLPRHLVKEHRRYCGNCQRKGEQPGVLPIQVMQYGIGERAARFDQRGIRERLLARRKAPSV